MESLRVGCGKCWNKKWIEWQVFVHWLQCSYIHSLFASAVIAIFSISSIHWLPQRRCAKEWSEEIDCTIWCVFLSFMLLLLLFHWLLYTYSHILWRPFNRQPVYVVAFLNFFLFNSRTIAIYFFSQSNITLTQMVQKSHTHSIIDISQGTYARTVLHACVLDIVDDDDG